MNKLRLYGFLIVMCMAGYAWLGYSFSQKAAGTSHTYTVCMIKNVTGVPCPSCGSTRSVMSLAEGHFAEATRQNPLGIVIALLMVALPIWIVGDVVRKSSSLFRFYNSFEIWFRQPKVAVTAGALLLINWIWSISKGI